MKENKITKKEYKEYKKEYEKKEEIFINKFEGILDFLSVDKTSKVRIKDNIKVRFVEEKEDTSNGKRQIFEIERKI